MSVIVIPNNAVETLPVGSMVDTVGHAVATPPVPVFNPALVHAAFVETAGVYSLEITPVAASGSGKITFENCAGEVDFQIVAPFAKSVVFNEATRHTRAKTPAPAAPAVHPAEPAVKLPAASITLVHPASPAPATPSVHIATK